MATKKIKKGKKLTKTGKWVIQSTKGRPREFKGTLLESFNFGSKRIAIFSVPKSSKL